MTDTATQGNAAPQGQTGGNDATTQNNTTQPPAGGQGGQSQTQGQGGQDTTNPFDRAGGDSLLDDAGNPANKAWDLTTGERPENLPESFWDPETKTVKAQDLFNKYQEAEDRAKGLRAKLSKGLDKAPKEPTGYTFKFEGEQADAMNAYAKADDPVVQIAQKAAHKAGMSVEQFNSFMQDLVPAMMEADKAIQEQAANPPELSVEERNAIKQREFAKIGDNAPAVIRAVESWGRELYANGVLSEGDVDAFKQMAVTGDQVRVLNKLRSMMGGGEIPMGDGPSDGLPSDREIADTLDKAYKSKDEAKIRKAEDLVAKRNMTRSGPMKVI